MKGSGQNTIGPLDANLPMGPGALTIYSGIRRLAVLVPAKTNGFLVFIQTSTDGLRQIGHHHPTLSAAISLLLQEVQG